MTTPLRLSTRQARLLVVRDEAVAIQFYTGVTLPSTPESTTTETLLGTIALATPGGSIGASGNTATLTLTVPRSGTAVATGIVGWARFIDALGDGIMDMVAVKSGTAGGPYPVVLSDTQVYAGGDLQLISCLISE